MKKYLCIFVSMLITLTIFANDKYEDNNYFLTTDRLKIRESSDLSSNVITVLDEGTLLSFLKIGPNVNIDNINDNWIKVKTIPQKSKNENSIEGWVFGGYVKSPEKNITEFSNKEVKCIVFAKNYVEPEKGMYGESENQYFFIENNRFSIKSITYMTKFLGPNYETSCYTAYKVSEGKKFLYLGFSMIDDGPYGVKFYKIDLSNIDESQLYFSYDEVKGNEQFIKNNVKLCISYSEGYNGKYERNPKQSYTLYKKADFNSKIVDKVSADDKLFIYFGSIMGEKKQIIFEEGKEGFWVQCGTPYNDSDTYYWTWIE